MRDQWKDVKIEAPEDHVGRPCHVAGWNKGCVFILDRIQDGVAILRTPKTGRIFQTRNALTYTRRQLEINNN